jgi:hypothetical protein
LGQHCTTFGRTVDDITCSALLRYESPEQLRSDAAAMADAGCDLGIISLPKTAAPSVVDEIADALA